MTDTDGNAQGEFTLRPLIIFAMMVLFVGTLFSFLQTLGGPSSLLCPMLGIPAFLIWLIVALVRLAASVWERQWRTTASQMVILVGTLPAIGLALPLGPYIHFAVSYPYYLIEVKRSADGDSKPATFGWGGFGFVGSSQTDRWLVYDPTDETAKRTRHRETSENDPHAWYEVEYLFGNFYLVERHQG
jgi:hypothetical protein